MVKWQRSTPVLGSAYFSLQNIAIYSTQSSWSGLTEMEKSSGFAENTALRNTPNRPKIFPNKINK